HGTNLPNTRQSTRERRLGRVNRSSTRSVLEVLGDLFAEELEGVAGPRCVAEREARDDQLVAARVPVRRDDVDDLAGGADYGRVVGALFAMGREPRLIKAQVHEG